MENTVKGNPKKTGLMCPRGRGRVWSHRDIRQNFFWTTGTNRMQPGPFGAMNRLLIQSRPGAMSCRLRDRLSGVSRDVLNLV